MNEAVTSDRPTVAAPRSGGRILVDQLQLHGVDHVFCVPGESYLDVLDALHDSSIQVTVCRQEGGAAMMSEAYGKLTGRPGICFATRGPGATNASPGLHVARQDSSPMILFVGQVERGARDREALQELDYRAVFGSIAKWVVEIDDPARIPELLSHAFHVATSGRPGPVVVALPEDMLVQRAEARDALPFQSIDSHPAASDIARFGQMLAAAKRPLAVLGGSRWDAHATQRFAAFAERFGLPVAVGFRRQMLLSGEHPAYVGDLSLSADPRLAERVRAADLILLLGSRLSEVASQGYKLLEVPVPAQRLVHVHPDAGELGRVYRADLAINASPAAFCAMLDTLEPPAPLPWAEDTLTARREYLEWSDHGRVTSPGALHMASIVGYLRERLPEDAILCNGAGNYAIWLHRFYRYRGFGTQLAPTSGSMGYGVPAAVSAKRLHPQRTVVAFAGDGCFLMNGQEFATAVQYDLPIIVVVIDNGMFGTIRMHQERSYPGRVSATQLRNPDFAGYAKVFGGHGERVARTDDFPAAFERSLASGKPSIIHCLIDQEAITPTMTLSALRSRALAAAAQGST